MRLILCAALAALAAACGQTTEVTEAPPPAAPPAPFSLEAMGQNDIQGQLTGELGCSFTVADDVLVVAMGNVDPNATSEALAKRAGVTSELQATATGGYDGMVEGASFTGDGLTLAIETVQRSETGNEQVAYNARLTATQNDGASRSYDGMWTCGP